MATISTRPHSEPHSNRSNTQKSPDERLAEAQAAGLSGDFATQYANSARKNTYKDTFWDKFRRFFGGKLGSTKMQEALDLEDQALLNELLNAQREQNYNSEEAQAERLRNAGINPDLDGGASLSPSEASQIDDEVLGAGLQPALQGFQDSAQQFPMQMAEVLMNGATAVLGFVNSGVDIRNKVQTMDSSALSDLLQFSKTVEEITFDPLNPVYKEYVDEEGSVNLQKLTDDFPLKTRRYKDIYKRLLSGLNSPENKARRAEAAKRQSGSYVGISEDYETINTKSKSLAASLFGNSSEEEFSPFHQNAINDPAYRKYVENVAQFALDKLDGDVKAQSIYKEYQSKLASANYGEKKAILESFNNELNQLKAEMNKKAVEQSKAMFERLIQESKDGNWISTLLLNSVISGSFQSYGLGDPYKLPVDLGNMATSAIGKIIDAIIPL